MRRCAISHRAPQAAQGFSITNVFMPRMPRFEKSSSGVNAEGERSLWVLDNGVPREVKVKTGASDGQNTVVLSGELKEGDAIITGTRQAAP